VLVGVKRAQRFAERLADAIAGIRPDRRISPDPASAWIKADGVIGRGEHDALDAMPTGGLEHIVATDDVGGEDLFPWPLDRNSAEMHDAVDARDRLVDLRGVGEVSGDEALLTREIGRNAEIAPSNLRLDALEQLAQARTDAACRAGDENCAHGYSVGEAIAPSRAVTYGQARPRVSDSVCGS
jgi:hypothetical protein